MSHVVLYDTGCSWEMDYITKVLLGSLFEQEPYLCHFLKTSELLAYSNPLTEKVILVFTSNLASFEQIKILVERLKPQVIFHLSDEWGTKPEFVGLSSLTKLVLRQHWFPKQYEPCLNIFPLPLGVMTKYPINIKPKLISERVLVWSFIGTVNHQRQHMIDTLYKYLTNQLCIVKRGGVKIEDVAATYNDSLFVPNERGAVRLDCFRLYEATISGAIPVVVGSKEEIAETFVHDYESDEKNLPPWIFASDWIEASSICNQLLKNKKELQIMQEKNLLWFWSRIKLAQKRIAHALTT